MINVSFLIAGLVVGGGVVYFYFKNKLANAENLLGECESQIEILKAVSDDYHKSLEINLAYVAPTKSSLPEPIPSPLAHRYHKDYFDGVPVLKTMAQDNEGNIVEQNIQMFTIEKASIENIEKAAGSDFKGVALIPGLIPPNNPRAQEGHTLILVGYGLDANKDKFLILPDDENDTSFIEDHIDVCPKLCVTNIQRLRSNDRPWTSGNRKNNFLNEFPNQPTKP